MRVSFSVRSCLFVVMFIFAASSFAVTIDDLRRDEQMTPQRFATYFSKFKFCFHPEVQSPQAFLATQSGDCDDYATLADSILSARGYTTRLISVRMKKVVHVVCYVEESRGYLDYQHREARGRGVTESENSLAAIADQVSRTFNLTWTSASEFTFADGVKRLVATVRKDSALAGGRLAAR